MPETPKRLVPRVKHPSYGESKTRSEFQEECHLPTMMKRWRRQGILGDVLRTTHPNSYGDFSNVDDYKTAMDAIRDAENAFLTLPAAVRGRFNNSPQQLLQALENPLMKDELTELGVFENLTPPEGEKAPEPPDVTPED